jgi:hypothetical protein
VLIPLKLIFILLPSLLDIVLSLSQAKKKKDRKNHCPFSKVLIWTLGTDCPFNFIQEDTHIFFEDLSWEGENGCLLSDIAMINPSWSKLHIPANL